MEKLPFGLYLLKKYFDKLPSKKKKVVAAYIDKGLIIMGVNQKKTSPLAHRLKSRHSHIHAEVAVLSRLEDASNGTLFIFRKTMSNEFALARPCTYCMTLLKEKNVKKIIYTTPDGFCKEKLVY